LENIWFLTEKYNTNKTGLSLSFIAAISGINTIIPGIKTEIQAVDNCTNLVQLENKDITLIKNLYNEKFEYIVSLMEKQG
jgi:hypothetical protein